MGVLFGAVTTRLHATAVPQSLIAWRPRVIGGSMSTMLIEVYDALKEAAPPKRRRAPRLPA